MKRGMPWIMLINFHVDELTGINLLLSFFFFFLIAILIFFKSAMTNNQTKYVITYEKIAVRADDDERMIMSGLIG